MKNISINLSSKCGNLEKNFPNSDLYAGILNLLSLTPYNYKHIKCKIFYFRSKCIYAKNGSILTNGTMDRIPTVIFNLL